MLDDHKFSLRRRVAYAHPNPGMPDDSYGPGGPGRTYGEVTEVHLLEEEAPHWEYTIVNSFTKETCRVMEDEVFHGANLRYLDLHRRDGIHWSSAPPSVGDREEEFWRGSLKDFVRTSIPKIREQEIGQEEERAKGRDLPLEEGDYIKVRGDLRPEMEQHHNLYAKIISVSPAGIESFDIPTGKHGLPVGEHKVLRSYRIRLDNGEETDAYDIEVKAVYTTNGRSVILNWRAATFLAEAFGDDPPYEVHLEFLNGHIFARSELAGVSTPDMGELLARLLYAKGLITREELQDKIEVFVNAPAEFLVDQILAISRFDMEKNRAFAHSEIEQRRADDLRLKELFQTAAGGDSE